MSDQSDLIHSLLGITTLEMIDSLSDNSLGRGRLPLSSLVERDMERFEDKVEKGKETGLFLEEKEEEKDTQEPVDEPGSQLKGVLFILDSMRKSKSAQRKLKATEILNLYKKVKRTMVDTRTGQSGSVKGILINKRHY